MTNDTDIELQAAAADLLKVVERWYLTGRRYHEPLHRACGRYGRAKEHWLQGQAEEAA